MGAAASRLAHAGMEEQAYAEQEAENAGKLPAETVEALEDAHSKHVALVKEQMAAGQRAPMLRTRRRPKRLRRR